MKHLLFSALLPTVVLCLAGVSAAQATSSPCDCRLSSYLNITHLEVLETRSKTVSGVVVSAEGKPVSSARVVFESDSGKLLKARTDSNGRFRIEGVIAGALYHVSVKHRSGSWAVSVMSFSGDDEIVLRATAF